MVTTSMIWISDYPLQCHSNPNVVKTRPFASVEKHAFFAYFCNKTILWGNIHQKLGVKFLAEGVWTLSLIPDTVSSIQLRSAHKISITPPYK